MDVNISIGGVFDGNYIFVLDRRTRRRIIIIPNIIYMTSSLWHSKLTPFSPLLYVFMGMICPLSTQWNNIIHPLLPILPPIHSLCIQCSQVENRIAILWVAGYKNPMFHPQFYVVPILIRIDTKLRVGCSSRLRDKGFCSATLESGKQSSLSIECWRGTRIKYRMMAFGFVFLLVLNPTTVLHTFQLHLKYIYNCF